jgi:dephospho-CoA kinase
MLIAGLTGGLGCGKSFVARELERLGCYVIEADDLGHEVLLPGGDAYKGAIAEFGSGILDGGGLIDRAKLAAVVFDNPDALAKLNALVHPAVRRLSRERFGQIGARDPEAIGIFVAAILVETESWREFRKLIVVDCSREAQIARGLARQQITREDLEARLARQLPAEKKRAVADYVIDANGTEEQTLRQTRMVFNELRRLAS